MWGRYPMTTKSRSELRIVIGGWPRTGKTTLANQLAARLRIPVMHTDDLIGKVQISEASGVVAEWLSKPGPWIIEGVTTTRGLRKWREYDVRDAVTQMRMPGPPPCSH